MAGGCMLLPSLPMAETTGEPKASGGAELALLSRRRQGAVRCPLPLAPPATATAACSCACCGAASVMPPPAAAACPSGCPSPAVAAAGAAAACAAAWPAFAAAAAAAAAACLAYSSPQAKDSRRASTSQPLRCSSSCTQQGTASRQAGRQAGDHETALRMSTNRAAAELSRRCMLVHQFGQH